MKHIYKVILSLIVFCFFSFFVSAQNVEEIISRHIDAHGGIKMAQTLTV